MYGSVSQHLLWDLSTARDQSCSLIMVGYRIHWFMEHRYHVTCISLLYRYYNGFCWDEIRSLIAENHVFLRKSRLSWQVHPSMVDWPVDRTLQYRQKSFFNRIISMWNSLRAEVVIFLAFKTWKRKNHYMCTQIT